jgi:hypothetical protein
MSVQHGRMHLSLDGSPALSSCEPTLRAVEGRGGKTAELAELAGLAEFEERRVSNLASSPRFAHVGEFASWRGRDERNG